MSYGALNDIQLDVGLNITCEQAPGRVLCGLAECASGVNREQSLDERVGNQLVSYTRQMDLVRIEEQAKFENAFLRTKHFRISYLALSSIRTKSIWRI